MVVRCTKKMLDLLGGRSITLSKLPPTEDDWYLNLLWIDRQKCILLTHAGTLFSVFRAGVRRADLRPLGDYLSRPSKSSSARRACLPTRSPSLSPRVFGLPRPRTAAHSAS
jgi:hypothetical protein